MPWRALARLFLGLVVALLAVEALARFAGLGPRPLQPPNVEPAGFTPFVSLPNGLAVYRPNVSFRSVYDLALDERGYFQPDGAVEYVVNRHGMRGAERGVAKPPGTLRVVCMGDSITFGEGVRLEDTYPYRLERLLGLDGGRVEVLNAGVQAFGTPEAWALFGGHLRRFDPDVVTLGFYLNDACPFAETVKHHRAQAAPTEHSWLGRHSVIVETLEFRRIVARRRTEHFESIRASLDSERWAECRAALENFQRAAELDGFRFVVVIFPVLAGLDGEYPFEQYHRTLGAALDELGCESLDLLEVFRGRAAESLQAHPSDHHPNELAHRLAAESLARLVGAP